MISTIALLSLSVAVVLGHPPIHANIQEEIANLVNELDSKLTSKPMLKITKALDDMSVSAGEQVTLQCEVLSTPSAVIYWERNGVRVQGDKEINVKEKMLNMGNPVVESGIVSSILSIPCAQGQDSGEYRCVAFNGHSTGKSTAKIVVEGTSTCKSLRRSAPVISLWTDSRFEMEGNSATLVCRSSEFASHSWFFEDKEITADTEDYFIQGNGDLLIKNIAWEDMGTYTCVAANQYGEDKVETFLYPTKRKGN
ncbi:hypothetical protein CRE_22356 [Caenorhabditis remanei]|uniref:Uncharacterized protein n=1 Tax=Caenorhabditis remanei TaxID=31234 RepID=E3MEA3_CAERE|nr:hypothetical protein CRE_22356 [Caenorhabditis remanei]